MYVGYRYSLLEVIELKAFVEMCFSLGQEFFGLQAHLSFRHTVLAEVERLLLYNVVLSDVAVLCRSQERLDALRVVTEGENKVFFGD